MSAASLSSRMQLPKPPLPCRVLPRWCRRHGGTPPPTSKESLVDPDLVFGTVALVVFVGGVFGFFKLLADDED